LAYRSNFSLMFFSYFAIFPIWPHHDMFCFFIKKKKKRTLDEWR
jgi:hypothetical protein